jgi:hypothetical protein
MTLLRSGTKMRQTYIYTLEIGSSLAQNKANEA